MDQEEKKQTPLGYLFLMPLLAVSVVLILYPLFYTIHLSFLEQNMVEPVKKFVGLANYAAIFRDPNSWKITEDTAVYIPVLPVLNFVLPYILPFILLTVIKGEQDFYKAVFFLPSVVSLMVGSVLYIWILDPISSPVALVLKYSGLVLPLWSKAEGWVIVVSNIITSWKVLDYNFIIILAGVSGVSQEVVEAARPDNIPLWKIFRDMVIPMSSATGICVSITTTVQGPQYVLTPIKVVTQGGLDYASSNLIYMSYHETLTLYRTGASSVASVTTMVLFIVPPLLEFRFVEEGVCCED